MRSVKFGLALAAGLLLVLPASAQRQGGQRPGGQGGQGGQRPGGAGQGGAGFGGFGGGGGLVSSIARSPELQTELKMDKEQVEALTAALTKAREESRELTMKLFTPGTTAEERTEIGKKVKESTDKAVATVLKPEQVKRITQLETQQGGLNMFTKKEVVEAIKITDEQKEKIAAITKELGDDRRELFGQNRRPDAATNEKWAALQKDAKEKAVNTLTTEQKSALTELTGAPFEFKGALAFGGGFGQGGQGLGGAGGFGGQGFGGAGGFGAAAGGSGQLLSPRLQDTLKLSDEQKKQVEEIQKEADAKLEKLLSEEQRKQLKEARAGAGAPGGAARPQPKKKDD